MNKRLQYLQKLADAQDYKAMEHWRKCKYCQDIKNKKKCKVYERLCAVLMKTEDLLFGVEGD